MGVSDPPPHRSPGWYPDPSGRGQRYFDGNGWMSVVRPGYVPASPPTPSPAPEPAPAPPTQSATLHIAVPPRVVAFFRHPPRALRIGREVLRAVVIVAIAIGAWAAGLLGMIWLIQDAGMAAGLVLLPAVIVGLIGAEMALKRRRRPGPAGPGAGPAAPKQNPPS